MPGTLLQRLSQYELRNPTDMLMVIVENTCTTFGAFKHRRIIDPDKGNPIIVIYVHFQSPFHSL
jgi:hypothetical protein